MAKLGTLQAVLAILFLFSGIYKGVVPFPVDLTVFTGFALCLSLVPAWRESLPLLFHPALWSFALLIVYLAAASWPLKAFGEYKIAESVVFGLPALAAGYVLARRGDIAVLGAACIAASVPMAAAIAAKSILNDTLHYSVTFLSGGYQLPAALLGFALLALMLTDALDGWWRFAAGALVSLGLFSTGSTINTFATLAIGAAVAAWSFPFNWRAVAAWASAIVLPVAVVTALVFPPPSITRLLLKYQFLDAQVEAPIDIEGIGPSPGLSEGVFVDIQGSRTDVTDRAFLFRAAIRVWERSPLLGGGFGSVLYAKGYRTPHNVPLELLAEGGIIAFLLGATFVGFAGVPLLLRRTSESSYPLALFLLTMATAMVGGYFVGRVQMLAIGAAIGAAPALAYRLRETAKRGAQLFS